jgi:hypothetical protein
MIEMGLDHLQNSGFMFSNYFSSLAPIETGANWAEKYVFSRYALQPRSQVLRACTVLDGVQLKVLAEVLKNIPAEPHGWVHAALGMEAAKRSTNKVTSFNGGRLENQR